MIYFLASLFDPSSWLETDGAIMGLVVKGLRTLFYNISTLIYDLIIKLYDLFYILCCGRLLDNDILKELASRIGLILGIMMFFIVSISFIKMLIDPDSITDKTKGAGNIIMKIFVVIVALGFSNFVFNGLYKVQNVVVQNHIISKILLPYDIDTDQFGEALSAKLFLSFYKIHDKFNDVDSIVDADSKKMVEDCVTRTMALETRIREFHSFDLGLTCLNQAIETTDVQTTDGDTESIQLFVIDYNWFLSIIVGAVVAYFLFSYAVTVGVRMIQLAFLEIVSPMAIVSHLIPTNDTPFNKWLKLYISTFVDVFIKIAIINFVVFLIAIMFESTGSWSFWQTICMSDVCATDAQRSTMTTYVTVAMILALLTFAKKVPDLINKIVPAGNSGLGSKGFSFNDLMGGSLVKAGLMGTAAVGAGLGLYGASKGVQGAKWAKNALLQKAGANSVREALGFGPKGSGTGNAKVDKALKGAGGVLGFFGGGLLAAGRAGWSGRNSKDIFGALSTGTKSASQSVLAANQRAAAGVTTGQYLSDKIDSALGITKSYDKVNKELDVMNAVMSSYENDPAIKKMASVTAATLEKRTNIINEANLEFGTQEALINEFNNNNLKLEDLYSKSKTTKSIPELGRIAEEIKILESRNSELQANGTLKTIEQITIERDNKIAAAQKMYDIQKDTEDNMKDATYMIAKANIEAKREGKVETIEQTTLRIQTELEKAFGKENIVINEKGKASFGGLGILVTDGILANMEQASIVLGNEFDKHNNFKEANKARWEKDAEKIAVSQRKS